MSQGQEILVDCYVCWSNTVNRLMGIPLLGCPLCTAHGNGSRGQIKQSIRHQSIVVDGVTYTPPPHSCVLCQDKKSYLANGTEVPCKKCRTEGFYAAVNPLSSGVKI